MLGTADAGTSATPSLSPFERFRAEGGGLEAINRLVTQAVGFAEGPSIESARASSAFLERVPIAYARSRLAIGLQGEGDRVWLAMADLSQDDVIDTVARLLDKPVSPVAAAPEALLRVINLAYQERSGQAESFIATLDRGGILAADTEALGDQYDLLDVAGDAPVVKLVSLILFEAVKAGASDVHLQPYEDRLIVRQRIDGVLFDTYSVPKHLQEEVISRIKVIGHMNIAEKRIPQDGRTTVEVGDRSVDLRIASLPTSYGERVVLRLLDKATRIIRLEELGMRDSAYDLFRRCIRLEHGLILITGPTGSGKSTSLYAALQEINATELNVVTLEDPIEYRLEGISQTPINEKQGMTFASGLRSVLRQDPDVIMLGEIRDRETAVMAIQSALTGHLVFSTLHTNDASTAVTRMLDLGIEPFLLGSSLKAAVAQRLVRRVCTDCSQRIVEPRDRLASRGLTPEECKLFEVDGYNAGTGCESCRKTGFKGRVGVFEALEIGPAIRSAITRRADASEVEAIGRECGMTSLRDDGFAKVQLGLTTPDEVGRVTVQAAG